MLQKYNRYRILEKFFDFPRKDFQIREISRMVDLAQISVMNHLKALQKEGLVMKEKKGIYPTFRADKDNEEFKILKMQNLIWRIYRSGIISDLDEEIKPDCIVLFGSSSRGEDTESSDIDLLIQSEEYELPLKKYEDILRRKINLFFEPDINKLNKELLNNIINGHVLHGYLKVF